MKIEMLTVNSINFYQISVHIFVCLKRNGKKSVLFTF